MVNSWANTGLFPLPFFFSFPGVSGLRRVWSRTWRLVTVGAGCFCPFGSPRDVTSCQTMVATFHLCRILWDPLWSHRGLHIRTTYWIVSTPTSSLLIYWFSQAFHKAPGWEGPWIFGCLSWHALRLSRTLNVLLGSLPRHWYFAFKRLLDVWFLYKSDHLLGYIPWTQQWHFLFGIPLRFSSVSTFLSFQAGAWLRDDYKSSSQGFE